MKKATLFFLGTLISSAFAINGGKDVTTETYPFYVVAAGRAELCGGTIIHPKWVMTAAHCSQAIGDKVQAGKSSALDQTAQLIKIKNIYRHAKYSAETVQEGYDIALLELETAFDTTDASVAVIQVLKDDFEYNVVGQEIHTMGLGNNQYGPQGYPAHLQGIVSSIQDIKQEPSDISRDRVIVGYDENDASKGACSGDSGGPMVTKGKEGNWISLGVTSFIVNCPSHSYSVRTSSFYNWLDGYVHFEKKDETTGNQLEKVLVSQNDNVFDFSQNVASIHVITLQGKAVYQETFQTNISRQFDATHNLIRNNLYFMVLKNKAGAVLQKRSISIQ